MKIACYILTFYFIALAGTECADSLPGAITNDTMILANGDRTHNQSHGSGWDECSPLCVCHCCHVHFLSSSKEISPISEKLSIEYFSYSQKELSIIIQDFLKPPIV